MFFKNHRRHLGASDTSASGVNPRIDAIAAAASPARRTRRAPRRTRRGRVICATACTGWSGIAHTLCCTPQVPRPHPTDPTSLLPPLDHAAIAYRGTGLPETPTKGARAWTELTAVFHQGKA